MKKIVSLLGIALPALCSLAAVPAPLTLEQAHVRALQKHPRISVAQLVALAGKQQVAEARSGYFPSVLANLAVVGVSDADNTRSVSTGLPVSAVVDRGGAAVFINQLLTDFGRTSNLTASAKLHARSQEENVEATRADILLEVDNAYISALRAKAVEEVAAQTVKERQLLLTQVKALEANQLRSRLDVSFAEVNAQQAELLLSRSENDLASAYTTLATLLDEPEVTEYALSDDKEPTAAMGEISGLIAEAFRDRPDLLRLRLELQSSQKFARAEGALIFPTISAQVIAGELPYHDAATNENYAAGGVVVNWPIFTGGLNSARKREAALKAKAAESSLLDATNNVARDVRIAWLNMNNAYRNMGITANLRQQAKITLDLAQARYNAGTSGMIELSQSQLSFTSAAIDETSARYEYLLRRSILNFQVGALK